MCQPFYLKTSKRAYGRLGIGMEPHQSQGIDQGPEVAAAEDHSIRNKAKEKTYRKTIRNKTKEIKRTQEIKPD